MISVVGMAVQGCRRSGLPITIAYVYGYIVEVFGLELDWILISILLDKLRLERA